MCQCAPHTGDFFEGWHKAGRYARGVYEGSYWELIGDCEDMAEMLRSMSQAPPLMEEVPLQLPEQAELPKCVFLWVVCVRVRVRVCMNTRVYVRACVCVCIFVFMHDTEPKLAILAIGHALSLQHPSISRVDTEMLQTLPKILAGSVTAPAAAVPPKAVQYAFCAKSCPLCFVATGSMC